MLTFTMFILAVGIGLVGIICRLFNVFGKIITDTDGGRNSDGKSAEINGFFGFGGNCRPYSRQSKGLPIIKTKNGVVFGA